MIPDIVSCRSQPSPVFRILFRQLLKLIVKPDLHRERSRLGFLPAVGILRLRLCPESCQRVISACCDTHHAHYQADDKQKKKDAFSTAFLIFKPSETHLFPFCSVLRNQDFFSAHVWSE